MNIAQAMIAEFQHESETTRKLLERLPEDKFDWKPHQKSMSLGRLATHIAEIPEWVKTIVEDEELDMAAIDFESRTLGTRQEVLRCFEENLETFSKILGGASDEHLFESWKLKHGDRVDVEMPRVACLRGFVLSHLIHHRGQLSVYLRQNDVPLPAMYGPSADEAM